jgi:hypothetical protein
VGVPGASHRKILMGGLAFSSVIIARSRNDRSDSKRFRKEEGIDKIYGKQRPDLEVQIEKKIQMMEKKKTTSKTL